MKDYKELIKNFTKEDFEEKRVNLHIHSTYSDGKGEFSSLIEQAKEKGYKNIALCFLWLFNLKECYFS